MDKTEQTGQDTKRLSMRVDELDDTVYRMKKMYEDLFYNLDFDNFSVTLMNEAKNWQQTFSEVYPDGRRYESTIVQNAREITLAVSSLEYKLVNDYWTAVESMAQLSITSTQILSTVSQTYETKTEAGTQYATLQSSISQTATQILSTVSATYETKTGVTQKISVVQQTADKIYWLVKDGDSASNFTLTSRAATLIADEINLQGVVKFSNLSTPGQTIISGSNIKTGTIQGVDIVGNNIISYEGIQAVQIQKGNVYFLHYLSNGMTTQGGIRYDDSGSGVGQARYRIYLYSLNGTVLKLQSSGNISIQPGGSLPTVFCYGEWRFEGTINATNPPWPSVQFLSQYATQAWVTSETAKYVTLSTVLSLINSAMSSHVAAYH